MANVLYTSYFPHQNAVQGAIAQIDLLANTINVALIDKTAYTPLASHEFLSDVAGAAILGTGTLATKTMPTTVSAFDAADLTIAGPFTPAIGGILFYKSTGVGSTSPLIYFVDAYAGFPTAAGLAGVTIVFPTGGIFTYG